MGQPALGVRYVAAGQAAALAPDAGLVRLDDHGLPIHGVLGGRPGWGVRDAGADREAAWLQTELDFGDDPELLVPSRTRTRCGRTCGCTPPR